METNELNRVDALRLDSGYAGQEELLRDLMAWLDLNLYYYYAHHQWLGPSSEMKNLLGLVVTREDFEHNLNAPMGACLFCSCGTASAWMNLSAAAWRWPMCRR